MSQQHYWLRLDKVSGAMSRSGSEGLEDPLLEPVNNSKAKGREIDSPKDNPE